MKGIESSTLEHLLCETNLHYFMVKNEIVRTSQFCIHFRQSRNRNNIKFQSQKNKNKKSKIFSIFNNATKKSKKKHFQIKY
jgi:hypothetical protein